MANYHDQIGGNSLPYLCFYGIDTLAIECFYPQILLDPFEEQFDLPATFIIITNLPGLTIGHVGQQHNILIVLLINQSNTSQEFRVTVLGHLPCQPDDLIALQSGRDVDRCGGFAIELQILFGPDHKPTAVAVQVIEPLEIEVPPLQNVETAGT